MKLTSASIWLLGLLLVCFCVDFTLAWDEAELEVFDIVEEVNQNFYELLGVPKNANSSDIKKAFRKLSLQLHPDKNSAKDAEIQFRNLVSVYDVLKDSKKRDYYDNVLINGLPNWRSASYYYRYVRKMGMLEVSIIVFIIVSVGQYLVSWASYFERRYNEQVIISKLLKMQKKNRKTKMDVPDLAEFLDMIPTPSVKNTLPFQLPRWTYYSIVGIPSTIHSLYRILEERKQRKKEEEEALAQEEESEPEPEPRPRGPRRRRQAFTPQERSERNEQVPKENFKKVENETANHPVPEKPRVSGGLWTDDDIHELIRLVKKFPGGTPERWEKIADIMNRTVNEVTFMAKKVKEEGLKPGQLEDEDVRVEEAPKKVKTRAEVVESTNEWSQEQQKAFEAALLKYPKSSSINRWEKIAMCVEGKTKEECQARYRYLVEIVKKKQTQ